MHVREREREKERQGGWLLAALSLCVCVSVGREREREDMHRERGLSVEGCECKSASGKERGRQADGARVYVRACEWQASRSVAAA